MFSKAGAESHKARHKPGRKGMDMDLSFHKQRVVAWRCWLLSFGDPSVRM
jgi:hypothetical protein